MTDRETTAGVNGRTLVLSLLLIASAISLPCTAPAKAEDKPSFPDALDQLTIGKETIVAADGKGRVAAWDSGRKLLGQWDRLGRLAASCVLDDPALPSDAADVALSDDVVLLSFFDTALEKEGGRREVVVDLRQCAVVSTFSVKGVTTAVVGSPDGWVQVSSPDELMSGRFKLELLDAKGKVSGEFDLTRHLTQLVKEKDFTAPKGPYGISPFVVGKETWVIPRAAYELWRPRQHGKAFRRVTPPDCLAAQGQELTGAENIKHVLELSKGWPKDVRESIERSAQSGGLSPSFLSPTSHIASWDDFIAVQVRDWKGSGGERIDIWNMTNEAIVAVVGIQGDAQLVAFNDAGLWLRGKDGRLTPVAVPNLWPETFDACAAVEALKQGVNPTLPTDPAPSQPPGASSGGITPQH